MDDPYSYEAAAEQDALHRSLHPKMRSWYEQRADLKEKHGTYPSFWRDFARWPAFKEVQREYMRWLDRKEAGLGDEIKAEVAQPAAPTITDTAAAIPDQAAAQVTGRKRRRWETVEPEAATVSTADANAAITNIPAAPAIAASSTAPIAASSAPTAPPKRKNRWSEKDATDSVRPPPMALPTYRMRTRFGRRLMPAYSTLLPETATPAQEMVFIYRIRLEEISARLMLLPYEVAAKEADPNRSPSPPAEYDATGKKINSREQRMRNALLQDRDKWLERIMDLNPALCGATGPRFARKIYVPVKDYPDASFMGRIIGPRGNTQKRLEKETNCKISIRGRGAGRENKKPFGPNAEAIAKRRAEEDDDDLHVAVIGERLSEVEAAAKLVVELLKPSDANSEWEKLQMVELAAYNGMIIKLNEPCNICGEQGHKHYECPHREANLKRANVRCAICGDPSHITSDCKLKPGDAAAQSNVDADYLSFMAEMGDETAKAFVQSKKDPSVGKATSMMMSNRGPAASAPSMPVDPDAPPGVDAVFMPRKEAVAIPKPVSLPPAPAPQMPYNPMMPGFAPPAPYAGYGMGVGVGGYPGGGVGVGGYPGMYGYHPGMMMPSYFQPPPPPATAPPLPPMPTTRPPLPPQPPLPPPQPPLPPPLPPS